MLSLLRRLVVVVVVVFEILAKGHQEISRTRDGGEMGRWSKVRKAMHCNR